MTLRHHGGVADELVEELAIVLVKKYCSPIVSIDGVRRPLPMDKVTPPLHACLVSLMRGKRCKRFRLFSMCCDCCDVKVRLFFCFFMV